MPRCVACGSTTIEFDATAGSSFCATCGVVLEENTIVAEISFGETSGGAAMVQGSFVSADATGARMGGPFGRGIGESSKENAIKNGKIKIKQLAQFMRLSERLGDAAQRWFNLCVTTRFIQGRRSQYVIAACLYVACRMEKTHHMLIDFSDALQINVFVLGHTYLKLVKALSLKLPVMDPSIYISRFAGLLEFKDETQKVATDAVRLVQRFKRDWMETGRRPAGICGACLYLAARMNNFRRSVEEIVQVVKIADVTLQKRLDEFKQTASGALTVEQFRTQWLEDTEQPPIVKAQARMAMKLAKKLQGKGKAKAEGDEDEADGESDGASTVAGSGSVRSTPGPSPIRPVSSSPAPSNFELFAVDPFLESGLAAGGDDDDDMIHNAVTQEVSSFLHSDQGELLDNELTEAEERRRRREEEMRLRYHGEEGKELEGLDEEELDGFLLSAEEVKIKTRLWVEFNRDYLERLAAKTLKEQGEASSTQAAPKKRKRKPRDGASARATTPAESTRSLIQTKKFSKKINYKAIEGLFDNTDLKRMTSQTPAPESEKGNDTDKEIDYEHPNEKSDEETFEIVEEKSDDEEGDSPSKRARRPSTSTKGGQTDAEDEEARSDGGDDDEHVSMFKRNPVDDDDVGGGDDYWD